MANKVWFRRAFNNENGTAAVELALSAPLLLLVLLAAVGTANAGRRRAVIARAALAGGRLAVVADSGEVENYVKRVALSADPAMDSRHLQVEVDSQRSLPIGGIIKPVRVTVIYRQAILQGFGWSPNITVRKSYTFAKWNNGVIVDIPAR